MREAIPLLLLLAACQREPVESAGSAQAGGACESAPVQNVVGRPVDQVRADAQKRSGAKTVRVYKTGSPVTMDYRADRLNLEVDEANAIVKVGCG